MDCDYDTSRSALSASLHRLGVLPLVLPAEPPTLLKLSGLRVDAFVGILPTEPAPFLDNPGLRVDSRIGVAITEEPFLLNDAGIGMDPRLCIFPAEEPLLLDCAAVRVDPVIGIPSNRRTPTSAPAPFRDRYGTSRHRRFQAYASVHPSS